MYTIPRCGITTHKEQSLAALLWRTLCEVLSRLLHFRPRYWRFVPSVAPRLSELRRLQEESKCLNIVRADLGPLREGKGGLQSDVYLGAARVLKVVADVAASCGLDRTVGSRAYGYKSASFRVEVAVALYRAVFVIVELARAAGEEANALGPSPVLPDRYLDEDVFLAMDAVLMRQMALELEHDFRVDLELLSGDHPRLDFLLHALRSAQDSALVMGSDCETAQDIRTVRSYRQVLFLWFLVAQDLACDGVTASVRVEAGEPNPKTFTS